MSMIGKLVKAMATLISKIGRDQPQASALLILVTNIGIKTLEEVPVVHSTEIRVTMGLLKCSFQPGTHLLPKE